MRGEKHGCEREVWICCLSHAPNLGLQPRSVPSPHQTSDFLVCRMTPIPLSLISQG